MDKKLSIVKKIQAICNEYEEYINTFGNECAYSDRMLEDIVENSCELAKESGNNDIIKTFLNKYKEV